MIPSELVSYEDESDTSSIIREISGDDYNYLADCIPRTDDTYKISTRSVVRVDGRVLEYLRDHFTPALGQAIFPITVPEDGNCLIHAAVYAMWGERKSYQKLFRQLLLDELLTHEEFYRSAVEKTKEDSESQGYSNEEFRKYIDDVKSSNAFLSFIHIFALSNVLRRPICICASKEDIKKWGDHEEGCAGIFLPTRVGAANCCAEPLFISWSSVEHYHFVPLCVVETIDEMEELQMNLPKVVYRKTLKNNETLEQYLRYAKLNKQKKCLLLKTPNVESKEYDTILKLKAITSEAVQELEYPLSFKDDPKDIAKEIIKLTQMPEENFQKIYDHVCSIFQKAKDNDLIEPKLMVRKVNKVCKLIPFHGDYHLRGVEMNLLREMEKRILDQNKVLAGLVNSRKYPSFIKPFEYFHVMNDSEIEKFQLLIGILSSVNVQDPLQYQQVQFPEDSLEVVGKLITWPLDTVFPVIDLVRVLILYTSAAKFFLDEHSKNLSCLFTIVLEIMEFPTVSFQCCIVILRLFLNLFSQKCLAPMLVKLTHPILVILDKRIMTLNYNDKQNVLILEHISKCYVNFAHFWQESPHNQGKNHRDSLVTIFKSCLLILNYEYQLTNDTIIQNTLISMGTILQKHARFVVTPEEIGGVVVRYLNHPNPAIVESMAYIVAIMQSEHSHFQLN